MVPDSAAGGVDECMIGRQTRLMNPVLHVRAFDDNYIWLIAAPARNEDGRLSVIIVDPGDDEPVQEAITEHRLAPEAILITHHHGDHTAGAAALASRYDLPVYGPAEEHIRAVSKALHDGDRIEFPRTDIAFEVMAVPGHTRGHLAYYGSGLLFCGDTLFSGGCGRLFEGSAAELHASLSRLASLPAKTQVYCAHEYTAANLRFALAVEPENQSLIDYNRDVIEKQKLKQPSLPSTIALECSINPFLRLDEPEIRAAIKKYTGIDEPMAADRFAALRNWKDHFR